MKTPRLFVLLAALILVALGIAWLWQTLETAPVAPGSASGASAAVTPAASRPQGEVSALENVVAPETTAARVADPARVADASREENFELESARWIEGRVEIPPNAPADETLSVWTVDLHGEEATNTVFYGIGDDPAGSLPGITTKRGARWAHRAVDASGGFRVPAPADASSVQLVLDGRYLYQDERRDIELPLENAPVVLAAKLGAWLVGDCVLPAAATNADREAGATVRVNGFAMGGPNGARVLRRSVEMTPEWTFELRGLAPVSQCGLLVEPKRMASAIDTALKLGAGQKVERTVTLTLGARVSGRVLDAAAAPVEGAEVEPEAAETAEAGGEGRRNRRRGFNAMLGGGETRKAISGVDGRFVLFGLDPGRARIRASKTGHLPARSEEFSLEDGSVVSDLELTLGSGSSIAGRVTFADGRPAAGATVLASSKRDGDSEDRFSNREEAPALKADAEGRFRFTGLTGPAFEVSAVLAEAHSEGGLGLAASEIGRARATRTSRRIQSARSASSEPALLPPGAALGSPVRIAVLADVAPGTEDADLVLQEPPGLRGRVVDARGAPITRFSISVEAEWEQSQPLDTSLHAMGFESADGRFFLTGVPQGAWRVTARAEGSVHGGEKPVCTLPTETELVITLTRAGRMEGRVVDPTGAAVVGASLQRRTQGESNPWAGIGREAEIKSGAEGRFVIDGVPEGAWELVATASGWAKSAPLPVPLAAGETLTDLVVALRVGGTLTGEVFDVRGGRLTAGTVQVFSMTAGETRGPELGSDGRFREEHLAPGAYQVILQPDIAEIEKMTEQAGENADPSAFLSQMKMTSCEIEDGKATHVVLGAPPKAPVRLHGRVTRAGKPVTKGTLIVLNEGGAMLSNMKFGKLFDDGRYEVTLNEPGDIVLMFAREYGGDDGIEFYLTVPEVAEHEENLELPLCAIRGRVLGPDREPLAGVRVEFAREDAPTSLMVLGEAASRESDESGRYAFEDLQPGLYTIAAGGSSSGNLGFLGEDSEPTHGRTVRGGLKVGKDQVLEGIDLVLTLPGAIEGVVRDAQGKPVSGATVFARNPDGQLVNRFASVTSDAAGKFTYKGLAPAAYTLSARTKTLAARDSAAVNVRAGESARAELVVETGTILRVTITDGDDKPVRASLSITDERGFEVGGQVAMEAVMELMSKGISSTERKFGPLAPGKYLVRATTSDGKSVKKPVTLSGQDERKLRLKLE